MIDNKMVNVDDEISLLVRYQDDEVPELLKMCLKKTYNDVYQDVAKLFDLEIGNFRLRKYN